MDRVFQMIGGGWHYEFSFDGRVYSDLDEFPGGNGYPTEARACHEMRIKKTALGRQKNNAD